MVLAPGEAAPAFSLPGESRAGVTLGSLTRSGPAVLVFFKDSCRTCWSCFPVFAEMARRYGSRAPVVAVAQDPLEEARVWLDDRGFGGVALDDHSGGCATAAAYGVDTLPGLVLVGSDGLVVASGEGWDRERANAVAALVAEALGEEPEPVSTEADGLPPSEPG